MNDNPDDITRAGGGLSVVSEARDKAKLAEGANVERQRIVAVNQYFDTRRQQGERLNALRAEAIDKGWSVERCALAYSDLVDNSEPDTGAHGTAGAVGDTQRHVDKPFISMGRTADEGFAQEVTDSLLVRADIVRGEKREELARGSRFVHSSMTGIAGEFLRRQGVNVGFMSDDQIVGEALFRSAGVGATASDFLSILANVAEKAAGVGYTETDETWRSFCRVGSVSNFMQGKRVALSAFSDLDEIPDGGSYKLGEFSDVGEPIQAKEYAKNFVISRKALIDDNVDAFTRIPQAMGRAAARKVGDVVFSDTLYGAAGVGVTLSQDSTAVFHSDHGNYVASGSAPSVSTLDTAFTAMAIQTDPSGEATLGIVPSYLIVPAALRATAMTLRNSLQDPAEGGTTSFTAANPFYQSFEVITESRLDNLDNARWYLAADPRRNQVDTIEVAFLNGQETPTIRQEEQITRSGVTFLVRLDFAVAALDYRGLYCNAGD